MYSETEQPASEGARPGAVGPDRIDGTDDVEELRRVLADTDDKWRRAVADLANLQKRFQRELARGQRAERERVLLLWLDTIDDLERALAHDDGARGDFRQGVDAIVTRAVTSIAGLGYPRFGAVGDHFDPALHEVVSTVPVDGTYDENVIVGVVKAGYGSPDALLRPATVVVAHDPENRNG